MVPKDSGKINKKAQLAKRSSTIELAWFLGQVNALIFHATQKESGYGPITTEALFFLSVIRLLGENATPGEIGKWMVRKQNSVSGMLNRLEEKGYVKRSRFKKYGNKWHTRVELTEEGNRIHDTGPRTIVIPSIFSCLSFEEQQHLREMLFRLRKKAAEEIGDFVEPPYPYLEEGPEIL